MVVKENKEDEFNVKHEFLSLPPVSWQLNQMTKIKYLNNFEAHSR